jgi:predicted 3-demethylubiquinone-9 3-methyltransferase (glyoxalase superfamily)
MQKISPFLWFDNNGEEAMNTYLAIFKDSKVIRIARTPPTGPGLEGAFLVATIQLEGQEITLMNGGPGHPQTDAFSLTIYCETQDEVEQYWSKLLEGGGKTLACGWLQDRFGVYWQVTPVMLVQLLSDPDRAKAGRVMQAMMKMIKLDIATLQAAADAK